MIRKVWLNGFRNFSDMLLLLSANDAVIILGKNNQGKTNLLEALFFMINGKSPRESQSEYLIQFDVQEALMGALLEIDGQEKKLYVRLQRDGQKVITLDEKVFRSFTMLKKWVNLAYLSADVIRVLQESPGNRRQFFDDFLTGYYPAYGAVLKKYKGCISQKNQILKQGGGKEALRVWNYTLLDLSEEIVKFRLQGSELLTEELNQLLKRLDFPFGERVLMLYQVPRYECEIKDFLAGYRSFLSSRLEDGMMKEFQAGYSLYGPHRDDFSILLDGKSLFHFFSRGVNRVMAILLTLAGLSLRYTQTGAFPIFLLDDTFAELDFEMKKRLLPFIRSKTQLFYTTVLEEDRQLLGTAKVIEIESGSIKEVHR